MSTLRVQAPSAARPPQSPFRRIVDDFFANPVATFGFGLLCLIVFFAIFAPLISPQNPYDLSLIHI